MNMHARSTAIVLGLSVSLVLGLMMAGGAAAGPGEHAWGDHQKRDNQMGRMAQHLDLSESQQRQMRAAMESHGPQMREMRRDIHALRSQMRAEGSAGFNEDTARAQADALGDLTAEAAFQGARMHSDMQGLLTDEQRQKLAQSRQQHQPHARMHGHSRRHQHQNN